MRCSSARWLLGLLSVAWIATSASAVTMAWTLVGDPGNPADTEVMDDGTTGYGSVPYSYLIGTYEVTNAQYVEFLNAIAATDSNWVYTGWTGIAQLGVPGSFSYAVAPGTEQRPVAGVGPYSAMRFANWMQNGQPTGAQDATTTEDGAYTMAVASYTSEPRNPGATIFLPSENEWYKAAYYDPALGVYHDFPGGPGIMGCSEPLPFPNRANCYEDHNQSFNPTDVGSYPESGSPYGTFDQGGNVAEWNEALMTETGWVRGLRGGAFSKYGENMRSSVRRNAYLESYREIGFRLATTVPEPDAGLLLTAGALGLAVLRRARA